MTNRKQFTTLVTLLVAISFASNLNARTCSGNGDVIGSYGFFGSRGNSFLIGATPPGSTGSGAAPLIPIGVTPPGTTGAVIGSNTPWGRFVSGLAGQSVINANGRVLADGAGNLFTSSTLSGLTQNNLVGTYTVYTDCTVSMSLNDSVPVATSGGASAAAPTLVTLEGVIVDSGVSNRIEAVVTGPNAAGAVVSFVRTAQFNACNNATITGQFGIVGSGLLASSVAPNASGGAFSIGVTGPLGTPFNLLGRFVADGSGNLVLDQPGSTSPVKRTLTGTYTVNADCTGTARLLDANNVARNIDFVLVNVEGRPQNPTQALRFVFSDPGVIGGGTATQQ